MNTAGATAHTWLSCRRRVWSYLRAARDSEASRDPRPAELIRSQYQAGVPAKPGQATEESIMHQNHPTEDQQHPGPRPTPGTAAMAGPASGSAGLVRRRQLEETVSWTGRERLRCLWYRLRLTLAEMNSATQRMLELQAPWIADPRRASDDRPR